ncbi:MAG: zinc-ribbon domain-containing protein [Burkholderiaceae bacterium]|nr:zinc-ribbon domain-containing protein [Burkholderiaceae bacterium]
MSLATSCPSCGTVFKVVEDQLKISEGWVRCGHCHDVFNALEGLFDLDRRDSTMQDLRTLPGALEVRPTPREVTAPTVPIGLAVPAAPVSARKPDEADGIAPLPQEAGEPAATASASLSSVHTSGPRLDAAAAVEPESPCEPIASEATATPLQPAEGPTGLLAREQMQDTRAAEAPAIPTHVEPAWSVTSPHATAGAEVAAVPTGQAPAAEVPIDQPLAATAFSTEPDAEEDLPGFVREARREARWSSRSVRAVLSLAAVALTAALAAQVLMHHRDRLNASCAPCRAPVGWLAERLELPIRPPIVVEAVEVDNAVLIQPPGVDGYRLTVQVRNRAEHVVASPHMELSLTDATGTLLIRRVLAPTDFRQPEQLPGGAENSWTLEFHSSDKRVAGYTVAAFYP